MPSWFEEKTLVFLCPMAAAADYGMPYTSLKWCRWLAVYAGVWQFDTNFPLAVPISFLFFMNRQKFGAGRSVNAILWRPEWWWSLHTTMFFALSPESWRKGDVVERGVRQLNNIQVFPFSKNRHLKSRAHLIDCRGPPLLIYVTQLTVDTHKTMKTTLSSAPKKEAWLYCIVFNFRIPQQGSNPDWDDWFHASGPHLSGRQRTFTIHAIVHSRLRTRNHLVGRVGRLVLTGTVARNSLRYWKFRI